MLLVAKQDKELTGFGDRLRVIRAAANVSLSEVGRRSGIAYQTIAKYERGENEPTWPTVLKIAKALGVTPDAFMVAENADPEPDPAPEAPAERQGGKKK